MGGSRTCPACATVEGGRIPDLADREDGLGGVSVRCGLPGNWTEKLKVDAFCGRHFVHLEERELDRCGTGAPDHDVDSRVPLVEAENSGRRESAADADDDDDADAASAGGLTTM